MADRMATEALDALMMPRSVAIVGASSDPRRFGGRPIQYLLEAGFKGAILPVNPVRSEIQGLPCRASIADLPDGVDCAIISLGAADSLQAIEQCAAKGIRAAVLFGAGFAELGPDGQALQDRIAQLARGAGMRLLGPNCMGLFNAHSRFYATFASALEEEIPDPGPIGLVSQSGGYGGYVMKHLFRRGLGFASWVTTGNECDVDAAEAIHWMAGRPEVRVITAYLEGVRDGAMLKSAFARARANGKPVVVMKVGRSAQGQAAAASHTASMAGEDAVYDAIFAKYGVHRAETTDELIDIAYALARHPRPVGRNVGVISVSGGVGVQIADYLDKERLVLASTPRAMKDELRRLVPACSPNNPIDMTGLMTTDHELLEHSLDIAFASGAFDAIIVFTGIAGLAPSMARPLREALGRAAARHPDGLLIVSTTTPDSEIRAFEDAGCLVYEDPSRATRALGVLAAHSEAACAGDAGAIDLTAMPLLPNDGPPIDEAAAKSILHEAGIAFPRECFVTTADEAVMAAEEIGGRVALKVVSSDIAHKTELGGVALNLAGPEEIRAAMTAMRQSVSSRAPDARITGFVVAEMVGGGVECIVGVHRDREFGPMVTFGLGGVTAELLGDAVIRPAPVSRAEADAMIAGIKAAPLLTGYRGSPRLAVAALADAIVAISRFAAANEETIEAVEINPLLVREHDVLALDALIQRR